MTVHKSQGSTYDTVYVDTEDLYRCAAINIKQYLKLMYVALSRASNKVITN
ncbi:MAG: ATP-binding domain-containing protein [Plesiomonas sp.]